MDKERKRVGHRKSIIEKENRGGNGRGERGTVKKDLIE